MSVMLRDLRTGGLEGYLESMLPFVGRCEGVIRGQHGLTIATGEGADGADVSSRDVAETVG